MDEIDFKENFHEEYDNMQHQYDKVNLFGGRICESFGNYRETLSCFRLKPIGSHTDSRDGAPDMIWVKSISRDLF